MAPALAQVRSVAGTPEQARQMPESPAGGRRGSGAGLPMPVAHEEAWLRHSEVGGREDQARSRTWGQVDFALFTSCSHWSWGQLLLTGRHGLAVTDTECPLT